MLRSPAACPRIVAGRMARFKPPVIEDCWVLCVMSRERILET